MIRLIEDHANDQHASGATAAPARPVDAPEIVDLPVADAFAAALADRQPLFLPDRVHADAEGWSIMNQFRGVLSREGQINFTHQRPGAVKAWHRHEHRTDFLLCLHGHARVGVYREEDEQLWSMVIGAMRPGVMIVPPHLWHGLATVGDEPAGLLYYMSHAYDPAAPDIERRPCDAMPGFAWRGDLL